MFFLFTADKLHVFGEQKVVLAVLPGIAVNFTDQKLCRLKSRKKSLIFYVSFLSTQGLKNIYAYLHASSNKVKIDIISLK